MATTKPGSQIFGRITRLTGDGYVAMNVPHNAKNEAIVFEGEMPFLTYKVGKETKKHSLAATNLGVKKGSRVIGFFDDESYDPAGLAELYGVAVEKVTPATHMTVLKDVNGKGGSGIYFKNPYTKPKKGVKQDDPEYVKWKTGEDGMWQKALLLHFYDPELEKERLANLAQENAEKTQPQKVAEEKPATPEENPVMDEIELRAVTLGDQLFEIGVPRELNGLNWAKNALGSKGLNHQQFKEHAISLFKYAYLEGQISNTGLLEPVIRFLEEEKKHLTATLATKAVILSPEHIAVMKKKSESIDGLLELIDSLFGVEEEEEEEPTSQPS
jgi:hypothetical protein